MDGSELSPEIQSPTKAPEGERRSLVSKALNETAKFLFPIAAMGSRVESESMPKGVARLIGATGDIGRYMTIAALETGFLDPGIAKAYVEGLLLNPNLFHVLWNRNTGLLNRLHKK